jgi:tetratricopeptide (TPR) repeat protein/transglutaminase-like putative cysteine protease
MSRFFLRKLGAVVLAFLAAGPLAAYAEDLTPFDYLRALQAAPAKPTPEEEAALAWLHHLYLQDDAQASALAQESLAHDPKNFKAHELLFVIAKWQGDYAARFEHFLGMLDSNRMELADYCQDFIYQDTNYPPAVWTSAEQLKLLESRLQEKLKDETLPPDLRTCLLGLLGRIYFETNRQAQAVALAGSVGFIPEWMIIGGFDNSEGMGFDKVFAPEKGIDFSKTYDGSGWKISWRKLPALSSGIKVDFCNLLEPNVWSVAYAVTFVYSPQAQSAYLRAGSDDCLKMWWNDQLVVSEPAYRSCKLDQQVVPVALQAGWNKLLAKVCQGTGNWELMARLTDAQDRPLGNLQFGLDPGKYSRPAQPLSANAPGAGVEAYWRAQTAQHPGDERSWYYLARWLKNHDRKEDAQKIYESLLQANPHYSPYAAEASEVYFGDGKPTKGLNALRRAEELAPRSGLVHYLLGRQYFLQRLYKKAEGEFAQAVALSPRLPEAYLYQGLLQDHENRPEEAYRSAKQALSLAPELSWANDNVAAFADKLGYHQEVQAYYLKARAANWGWFSSVWKLGEWWEKQGDYDQALALYQSVSEVLPDHLEFYFACEGCFFKQKKYPEALAQCRRILAFSPDNYRAYTQLGLINYEMGNTAEARANWNQALIYKPDYFWLRNYVEKRFQDPKPFFEKYQVTDKFRDSLLAAPADAATYPKASAVVLLNQEIVQAFESGYSTHQVHYIVKIVNETGRDRYGVAYLPESENLKIKKAYTLKTTGEKVEPTDIQKNKIAFAAVETGAVIECQYTYDDYNHFLKGQFYDRFAFQEETAPRLFSQYVLALPKGKALQVHLGGDKVRSARDTFQGLPVYLWTAKNQEQIYTEPYRPAYDELTSQVRVSTLPSWDYLAMWENSLVKEQLKPDRAMLEKIRALTAPLSGEEEKIKAIYNFVTKEIRYLRRDDQYIFFMKPQKAENVFADGYGVCKDKATLLIALLKACNLDAQYALIMTRNNGTVFPEIPYPYFNHAIVYLPPTAERAQKFLDPTSEYNSYGDLWGGTQGVTTLVCQLDHFAFITTPTFPPEADEETDQLTAVLDAQGKLTADVQSRERGGTAQAFRYAFADPSKRREIIEAHLNHMTPGAQLQKLEIQNQEDLNQPLLVNLHFEAPAFAHVLGRRLTFKLFDLFNLTERMASRSERHYALDFSNRSRQVQHHEYELPTGYKVASLPEPIVLETPWMKYEIQCRQVDRKIVTERIFTLKEFLVPQEKYAPLRQFCIQADAADQQDVILEKE